MSSNASGGIKNADFLAYVSTVKEKSEDLIKNVFPKRISELNALLESPMLCLEARRQQLKASVNIPVPNAEHASETSHRDKISPGGKKRKCDPATEELHGGGDTIIFPVAKDLAFPCASVCCNNAIVELFEIVKPKLRELVEHSNLLKMWVTLLIPKIEDGNNFGVSIQEDTLLEIRLVEAHSAVFYEEISKYHINRAKFISKLAKYPKVDDYRRVIAELDEKEFMSIRLVVSEIRNHYASLFDLISKNWEKIIKPRNSHNDSMY